MRHPLSPHLQVYRVQISSGISALHRITGVVLSVASGKLMVALFIMGLFPQVWEMLKPVLTPFTLKISLSAFGSVWIFHTLASVRHLYWDTTRGLALEQVVRSGRRLLWVWFVVSLVWGVFVWRGNFL